MTEKQKYWLANADGDKALVEGREQRDRFVPLGWSETTEPAGDEWVIARMDGIENPARFPAAAFRLVWEPRGWVAAPPAEPVSPFNGGHVPAPAAPPADVAPADTTTTTSKSKTTAAASGDKEKTGA